MGVDWLHISEIPGYQARLRGSRLHLCADENVKPAIVSDLRDVQGLNVETAADAGRKHRDDHEIIAWARERGRPLLTFNHTQFWNDGLHRLIGCPGIIAVSIPDTPANIGSILNSMEQLIRQLADHVPNDWWIGTKIRLQGDGLNLRQRQGGATYSCKIKPNPQGHLYFKKD